MKIDEKVFDDLAEVSRLTLGAEEKDARKKDLEETLDGLERLNELELTDIPEMTQPSSGVNRFREDVVTNEARTGELLANAPDSSGPYFRVPRTVEE